MDLETARQYALSKKATTEGFPFDDKALVFKVLEKMFAVMSLERLPTSMNLKCDPERVFELREQYPESVLPAWHMNKTHWNSIVLESELSDKLIRELIDHSYDLVVAKMTKKMRAELEAM